MMFRIFLLSGLFLLNMSFLNAQRLDKSEVPKAVQLSFKKTYPGDFPYEWKYAKKKKAYKAYFVSNGLKYKSYFNPNGDWRYAKAKIGKEELPEKIWKHYYESEWFDWKLNKTQIRLTPDCGKIFILNVKRGKKSTKEKVKIVYDENGNFIKHQQKY